MSTKIYNGIRFRERTLDDLHRSLIRLGPLLREKALSLCRKQILFRAATGFDNALIEGTDPEKSLYHAMNEFSRLAADANVSRQWSPINFQFSVTVMSHRGRTYGLHHGCREITKLFLERSGAEDFHYQDQSDRPSEVPRREWESRGNIWTAIFRPSAGWIPSEVGATYELVPETPTWMYGDRRAFAEDMPIMGPERFSDRCWRELKQQIEVGAFEPAGIADIGEGAKPSEALSRQCVLRDWLTTEAGQAHRAKRMAELAKVLPPALTLDHLWPEKNG